jgi:lysyl-tRNA synthetase class 2
MAPPTPTDWRPTASWETLALRARLLARARDFFAARQVTEVETPALVAHGVSDPHLANLKVRLAGPPERSVWLHTSPEYHMKRLLAAGAPDIYQICKVFRDGESGRRHEPEFTLVEWYRRGMNLETLAAETCELVRELAREAGRDPGVPRLQSYRELFREATGLDPLAAGAEELRRAATAQLGGDLVEPLVPLLGDDPDAWQDFLMGHRVIPSLASGGLRIVARYPAGQAALARLTPGDPRTAERFEVFWDSLELANGYHELTDAAEQARRFEADAARRHRLGRPPMAPDTRLLAALEAGLPDCAGVALGLDRVVMKILGVDHIRQAVSFPAPED